jgi:hypothetical protein
LLFSSIGPSQAQKTIPPTNTDRLSSTGDLALNLLVGLFLLGLLLGPSLILFLLLSLLFYSVRKRHKNKMIYMRRRSAVGNVHVSEYLLTKDIPPAVILSLLRLLTLRSHTGEHTRGDECTQSRGLSDYSGLNELQETVGESD